MFNRIKSFLQTIFSEVHSTYPSLESAIDISTAEVFEQREAVEYYRERLHEEEAALRAIAAQQIEAVTSALEVEANAEQARQDTYLEDLRIVEEKLEERIAQLRRRISRAKEVADQNKALLTEFRAREAEAHQAKVDEAHQVVERFKEIGTL